MQSTMSKVMVVAIMLVVIPKSTFSAKPVNAAITAYLNTYRTAERPGGFGVCTCHIADVDGPYGNCIPGIPNFITTCPDDTCTFVTTIAPDGVPYRLQYCGDERGTLDCYREYSYGHIWNTCYCTGQHCNTNRDCECDEKPTTTTTIINTSSSSSSSSSSPITTTFRSTSSSSTGMVTTPNMSVSSSTGQPIFTPLPTWYPSPGTVPPYSTPPHNRPTPPTATFPSGSGPTTAARRRWTILIMESLFLCLSWSVAAILYKPAFNSVLFFG